MKQLAVIALLVLLTLASFLFIKNLESTLRPEKVERPIRTVAIAQNATGRYFSSENILEYDITSTRVKEYSHAQGTSFEEPYFQVWAADASLEWSGSARTGQLSADKERLILTGDTRISQESKEQRPVVMTGEKMTYYSSKHELSSELPVTITDATTEQVSESFVWYTDKQVATFSQSVRAHFQAFDDANNAPHDSIDSQ